MQNWLHWTKQIKAISQAGKTYGKDGYDLERYQQLEEISHQMLASLAEQPVSKVDNLFIDECGYPTPKVDLRAGVINDNKILLVRERTDNRWSLPGGWADVNEAPKEGIIREVLEESGYHVSNPQFIALKDRALHPYKPVSVQHIYKLFFICDFVGGEPTVNLEVSEIGFFSLDNLPELSTGRVLAEDIAMLFEYQQNPGKPTYID
ncbi:NUDIX hydrolase [Pseudoalteromonas sp.]|uniref:NUDIX hydrolase n=1 Tax=unclassified Pseudoalteromonas TaxID=194690 RepID=UPI003F9B436D